MSSICKNWSEWLKKTRFSSMDETQITQTLNWLDAVKLAVLKNADINPTDTVIDIGTGTGLLGFGALELLGEQGKVIFSDKFEDCLVECKNLLDTLEVNAQYDFLQSGCEDIQLEKESVDRAVMRSVLVHIVDKQQAINEIFRILKPNGIFSAFEPVMRSNTRYTELLNPNNIDFFEEFRNAENEIMSDESDPLTNFDQNTLAKNLEEAGFKDAIIDLQPTSSTYIIQPDAIENSFNSPPSPGALTMRQKFLKYFNESKVNDYIEQVKADLSGKEITTTTSILLIKAIKN